MSVLIKGMEMPECCGYCPFEYKNYCLAKPSLRVESADRHPRCPLVPVQPHGRLVDADAIPRFASGGVYTAYHFIEAIADTPTIVPAERSGE